MFMTSICFEKVCYKMLKILLHLKSDLQNQIWSSNAVTLISRIDVPSRLFFSENKSNPPLLIKPPPLINFEYLDLLLKC